MKYMHDYNLTNKYVKQVYNELDHCIVIGLTGRCGSGCSTTRDILNGQRGFYPEDFLGNPKAEYISNKERDREIILNFASQNSIIFDTIRVRDIITSYILDELDTFFLLLNELFINNQGDGKKIKEDFFYFFKSEFNNGKECIITFDEVAKRSKRLWEDISKNIYRFIEEISEQQYDLLFHDLSEVSEVIRKFLLQQNENAYTVVYQYIGSIIRSYGKLKSPEQLIVQNDEKGMHAIAKRINYLLKIFRRKEWIDNNYLKKVEERDPVQKCNIRVVIDSIKNVFEADYLRARYQSFYLVALTLDNETRKQRLQINKGLSELQIDIIDSREQPAEMKKLLKSSKNKMDNYNEKEQISKNNFIKTYYDEKIYAQFCTETQEGQTRILQDVDSFNQSIDVMIKNNGEDEYTKPKVDSEFDETYFNGKICAQFYKKAYEDETYMFKLQDVDSCVQNADILINNSGTKENLSLNIMRYVCLMQHPGLVPPTIDERCMQVAQSAKLNSGCISRQVGAVVSDKNGKILSVGWNDAPASGENECISCIRRSFFKLVQREDEMAYSYFELNHPEFREKLKEIMRHMCDMDKDRNSKSDTELYNTFVERTREIIGGLPLSFCFKDLFTSMKGERNQIHTRAQHGEENALEACDKNLCQGGTLYTTSSSCELCAKKALSYNIKRIVYIEPYSGITNDHVLGHSVKEGVKNRRDKIFRTESMNVELFTGATQSAYVRLYTPIFPLKDELRLLGVDLQ